MRLTLKIIAIFLGIFIVIALLSSMAGHIILSHTLANRLGRDVSASFVYVNPLTGGVYVHNLRCTETDGDTPFLSAHSLSARVNTLAFAVRKVSIRRITLDQLSLSIVNHDTCFNFSDIPGRFRRSDNVDKPKGKPWAVSLARIKLKSASVGYAEPSRDINWHFADVTLAVPGLDFDANRKDAGIAVELPDGGGRLAVDAKYDSRTKNFTLTAQADNLTPKSLLPVIKEHLQIDDLRANVSTDIVVEGTLDDLLSAHISGTLDIKGLDMRDGWRHSVAKCQDMSIALKDISLKTMQIDVDKLHIDSLALDLKTTSDGSTWSRLLRPLSDKVTSQSPEEPASTDGGTPTYNGKKLTADNLRLRIGNLSVAHSSVSYEDKTLPSTFKYALSGITAEGVEIDTRSTSNHILLTGNLPDGGSVMLNWRGGLNPTKSACRAVAMLRNVKLKALSPWTEYMFGYAISSGTLSLTSDNTIMHGKLDATERLDIMKPELGKKLKKVTPLVDVPLKLAIGLLKNPQGNIEIQVPISGDINSPDFKLSDIIGKAVGNFLLQATASPFVAMAKARNRNDDLSFVGIDMLIPDFTLEQYQKFDLIAQMMNDNDDLTLTLTQCYNTNTAVKEQAVFDLKRDYYLEQNPDAIGELTVIDIQKIISIRDGNVDFQSWCKKHLSGRGNLTEKAIAHYGSETLVGEVNRAVSRRNEFVFKYLTGQHGIDKDRVTVNTATADELHKYKGKPQYTVSAGYEGN